ncbi:hypothetical protein AALG83_02075 [Christensenellaceae bacterium 44-20]
MKKTTLRITGINEIQDSISATLQTLENFSTPAGIDMAEILTPEFLQTTSSLSSFDELLDKSGFKVETQEDFIAIPEEEFDQYIRSISSFNSWSDMLDCAFEEYIANQLEF